MMSRRSCSPVTGEALRSWVPQGILIANLFEHSACVNEIGRLLVMLQIV